ncbi:MAG: hypothetical protein JOZ61_07580 [Verrucomicrobia bacterium]|nr:hypothetical protein [Verrucomicrobiota bacterium]
MQAELSWHDPAVLRSGITLFGENGFILEAFPSDAELTKALLHETIGLVTSESVSSVSGKSRTAGTGAKVFLGVLIGAAVVGGVAAIVLSAGAAALPGIIVALEAGGDVVVGTELVDVAMGNTP